MNFYPFHIGDYRSATMHLSNDEDLAYRRLLEMYYDTESPIPTETQSVSRRLRVGSEHIQTVLNEFFTHTPEGWRHARCDAEIAKYHRKAELARVNGKGGGRPKAAPNKAVNRNGNQVGSESDPNANRTGTGSKANQEPRTNNQEPIKRESARGSRLPADFALPDDWIAFCETERPDLNPYDTGKRFADYWHGIAGAKGRKADWLATWRNWVRNEKTLQPATQARETFKERDARLAREQMDGWLGRRTSRTINTIDVTPDVPFLEHDHE